MEEEDNLLECQIQNVDIEIDQTSQFHMVLPSDNAFYQAHLPKEDRSLIDKIEKKPFIIREIHII